MGYASEQQCTDYLCREHCPFVVGAGSGAGLRTCRVIEETPWNNAREKSDNGLWEHLLRTWTDFASTEAA